jgi:PAS domain S-box-containing protein
MCKVNDKTFIFEQIEENIPGIIYRFIIDDIGKFRFTYISKSIQEIYKVKPEIVINSQQNLNDYISSNEIDSLNQSIETAYLNKSVWEWKGSITIGKITRVISTKAKLDKNDDTKKVWTGFAFDITEQENLKKEIHSRDKKIRALAHNFPGIIYEWVYNKNKTFGFNYVSNKVKDILGLEPNQMIKIYSMLKPNELDRFINSIEHCAENQLDWNFKTEVYLKNGQKKHIEFIATPSQKTNGQLFYSGIIFDITETKKL